MKFINKIKDHFNKAEFTVAPNKKLKTLSKEFKQNFDLSLVFYKGKRIAEGDLTLKGLDTRTQKKVVTNSDEALKIKGSMKVGDVEKEFKKRFGVVVQIKDKSGKILVPNNITLGQASRKEY